MEFDTIDKQMRQFEQSQDRTIPMDSYLIARLDGHGFTRLTKKEWDLERPYDTRFRDIMVETTKKIMEGSIHFLYGYTQSDEISLLFHLSDDSFNRKERKLLSLLAGAASAYFSVKAERAAIFDCRLIPLPSIDYVVDYFRWRQEDCHRNSLNSYCYWTLRNNGASAREATQSISKMSNTDKKGCLLSQEINYDTLPCWIRNGIGLSFKKESKIGFNPQKGEKVKVIRNVIYTDYEIKTGEDYSKFIKSLIS